MVAVFAAIALLPLLVVIGLMIRLRDGAPVIVALPRVGRRGVTYRMWKFRTMRPTSAGALAIGPRITSSHDERITDVGRRFREHRLDELPQLVNVIAGEMALIGPRPETPEFVNQHDGRWREVLSVPPGIAGITQLLVADLEMGLLTGPATACDTYARILLPLKLELDRFYVRHRGPRLDLAVLLDLLGRTALGRPAVRTKAYLERHDPELATYLSDLRCHEHATQDPRIGG